MAFVIEDHVRENSLTTGTGAIALGGAVSGHRAFSSVMSDQDTTWYAIVMPGSGWETGTGTYNSASNTLSRTEVLSSSNSNTLVSFAAGTKDVFITQPAKKAQPFPSGTLMLFQQSTAPLFWTKQTTHNDKALRVVSGTASSGGTNAFSTVNAQTVVGNTTITQSTMASHTHGHNANSQNGGSTTPGGTFPIVSTSAATINSTGGDGAHTHSILMNIQFVDLIIAQKD
jgi:hypothetical protein